MHHILRCNVARIHNSCLCVSRNDVVFIDNASTIIVELTHHILRSDAACIHHALGVSVAQMLWDLMLYLSTMLPV